MTRHREDHSPLTERELPLRVSQRRLSTDADLVRRLSELLDQMWMSPALRFTCSGPPDRSEGDPGRTA